MVSKGLKLLVFFWLLIASAAAQLPFNDFQQAYDKGTRDRSGQPGKNYWQNSADYDIDVNFNPTTRLLTGNVTIDYRNNSPDQLKQIWFKLYPNLYQKGVGRKSKINDRDLGEGLSIQSFVIDGKEISSSNLFIEGTNMHIDIPGLKTGSKSKIKIRYSYTLNQGSHVRTGQVDSGAHFLAYFFPRVAVYDDIDGWNKIPYSGEEEFYNDFCNFKVAITVPRHYAVWATGDLLNPTEVFLPHIAAKLARAENQDEVIDVIDNVDLQNFKVTSQNRYNTFKFNANNIVDFAFATSNHYLWKSTSLVVDPKSKRRTRVDAVFNPAHQDYYEVIDFAKKTVHAMSYSFPKWPFPYSHETIFDGLDQMEYPMMVNDNPVSTREDAITLTDHEIFHTMFPFYMGINETKYAWMDEGWATIGEWLISPMIDSTIVDEYGVAPTGSISGTKADVPIMTKTTDLKGASTFTNNYPKPAFAYLFVKDYLGEELFTKALHHYINTWKGKHPIPYDFFNCMNEGSGKNMDWFWKAWFFEEGVLDLAINSVDRVTGGYKIVVENKSQKPLPVDLIFTYEDGSSLLTHYNIGIWEKGDRIFSATLSTEKTLKKVELKHTHVPDKNRSDNTIILKN